MFVVLLNGDFYHKRVTMPPLPAPGAAPLLGVWASGESLMDSPLDLRRPVARGLVGDRLAVVAYVIATPENLKHPLVKRLPANLTETANVDYSSKRERIPPTPTNATELVSAVAIEADVPKGVRQNQWKEEQCW